MAVALWLLRFIRFHGYLAQPLVTLSFMGIPPFFYALVLLGFDGPVLAIPIFAQYPVYALALSSAARGGHIKRVGIALGVVHVLAVMLVSALLWMQNG
jgi:hypothetical protein